MTPWEIIPYITSSTTLVALIVVVYYSIQRAKIQADEKKLEGINQKDKAALITELEEKYHFKHDDLTPDQKFELIKEQLKERSKKRKDSLTFSFRIAVLFFLFLIVYLFISSKKSSSQSESHPITFSVFLHGKNGRQDIILKQGQIVADFENDRRIEKIDEKGAAYFKGIPATFSNKNVRISLLVDTYAPKFDTTYQIYNNAAIYIEVVRTNLDIVHGIVIDDELRFVNNAMIQIDDIIVRSDSLGKFTLKIPEMFQQRQKKITVFKEGYKPWFGTVTPETKELAEIKLSKLND